MTTFEVTRDVIQFSVGTPVTFDVVPTTVSFTTGARDGADGTSFTARGPWDSGNTYALGDVVSFDGANYILYAASPTGDDPSVDTAHWDTFGSGSGVSPSRSIATTSPLAGGGDLSADRTLSLNIGTGLTTSGGNLVPDFGATSGKVTQGNDSRLSDARTPTSHASSHADGGSDEIAVGLAQLTQSGATTGQVPKWNGSAWSPDDETGGGSSLPDPTGSDGAFLGTDGSTWAPARSFTSPDGKSRAIADDTYAAAEYTDGATSTTAVADSLGAMVSATNGTDEATARVNTDGSLELTATGAVTVTAADGVEVVADDASTKVEPGVVTIAVADDADYVAPRPQETARSRGAGDSPTAVEDGDVLAYTLDALAYDGTGYVAAAEVKAVVDGTVDTDIVPASIVVSTADETGALTERIRHSADGTTDITGSLTVNGSPVSGGGGSSLPDPTGNEGAVLGTNGTAASWARSFTSPDGETVVSAYDGGAGLDWDGAGGAYAYADVDGETGAFIAAGDGVSESTSVKANLDGTVEINATGAVTVTPGDGFHVVGSIGETFLTGDDWGMSTASDVPETAPGASSARARGDMETPTVVADGDALVYPVYAQGFDGTGQSLAAMIVAKVAGTVDTGKVPGLLLFATADADGVLTDRLVLNPDGTSELNGTLLDLDTSGASTGDVATWDGTKIVLDTPTGGGGGGLVLVDSGTFSGSSGFNVDGVFDSTYDDYLVVLVTNGSTDIQLGFRLRASGTDSSSDYSGARLFAYGTTAGVQVNNLGSDEWQINNLGLSGPPGVARLDLYGPAVAAPSAMLGVSGGYFSSTGTITTHLNGSHDVSTAYDGFAVRPDTGTITGRWAVYGYAK